MNKIFKIVWSKSRQCYIVVSEYAKNTSGKKAVATALLAFSVLAELVPYRRYGQTGHKLDRVISK